VEGASGERSTTTLFSPRERKELWKLSSELVDITAKLEKIKDKLYYTFGLEDDEKELDRAIDIIDSVSDHLAELSGEV